ncbi:MAG: thioredoxin [Candidatus Schekmanbacteria bacterium GWA2_38_11]|uniref:Thioredoxin n=1 Tax=Candidatus Schekmanbacteria bacterium GWA2_38_11 TaxID=1817876 RepID=A0A1F7RND5_9BACT|nr:MAG: thioredoxin [Candidatus Schekmanbacteria bacterium GWA2_38_11]
MTKFSNRLINETSPYLLQHAHNPVDWCPWGEEALTRAKRENKPILLSIGYSACHWCHVMEKESFENEEIAKIMNENFINIKVDREERPDLDEIYMNAVQLMTGSGGWPMTVFLTPDLLPFYAGTYFPPEERGGMPSFKRILLSIAEIYREKQKEVLESTEKIKEQLGRMTKLKSGDEELTFDLLHNAFQEISEKYDYENGGFSEAPKFPQPLVIEFLFRYYKTTKDKNTINMITFTLKKMAEGGIYDHLGGGFHRYSVDNKWLVPHFEKMLYDNAMLAKVYIQAYQITKNDFFKKIAFETLDYLLREMTDPEGGFYSASDADSEGEEGKFFVWSKDEIEKVLGKEKAKIICRYYNVSKVGNFEGDKNILHTPFAIEDICKIEKLNTEEFKLLLKESKEKLFNVRNQRVKPGVDTKVITAWTSLAISSLAFAYQVFREERFLNSAEDAANFILLNMFEEGKLLRIYKDGKSKIGGFLEDYSFFISTLIDLYETTFRIKYLEDAINLTEKMVENSWDEEEGGFFFAPKDATNLISRSKNPYDNPIPSGNSVAVSLLFRLYRLTGNKDFLEKGEKTLKVFSMLMERVPSAFPNMLSTLDNYLRTPVDIVVVGEFLSEEIDEILKSIFSKFLPNKTIAFLDPINPDPEPLKFLPLLEGKKMVNGKPTVYICENFTCNAPITDMGELEKVLERL